MKKDFAYLILILTVLMPGLIGCFDEKMTENPSHLLSFSTDSVKFDTIFTDKGTATAKFKVYNRNDKALRIESIWLAEGERSHFYINVDGEQGPMVGSIVLGSRDSLFVFVEANIDPTDSALPFLVKDSIVFVTNGVRQDVKLEAYGRDAVVYKGGKWLTTDTTFTAERPFLIYDSLVVAPGVTWRLDAGVTLYMHSNAFIRVEGTMEAQGDADRRVTLRGDRTDNLFPDLPYDYYSGQWGGIHFTGDSYDNRWDYVDMHGSSWGVRLDSSDVSRDKLFIDHSIVHNSATNLISATYARVSGYNSQITNAGGAVLNLTASPSEWIHCTIANYYNWNIISSAMLSFTGYETNDTLAVELQPSVRFANCITASRSALLAPTDILGHSVTFDRCLFSLQGEDDENFISCIWGESPKFVATGEPSYLFDFRLSENSPARAAGDTLYLNDTTAIDLYGVPRLTDGTAPDLGASCYIAPQEKPESAIP